MRTNMENTNSKAYNLLIQMVFVIFGLIVVATTLGNEIIASDMMTILYGLTALLMSLFFIKSGYLIGNEKMIAVILIFFSFLNVIFNALISSANLSVSYFVKIFIFSFTVLWLLICPYIILRRKTLITIFVINVIIAVVMILTYRSGFNYDEDAGRVLLTLNFPNSNLTGLFIVNNIIYLVIYTFNYRYIGLNRWFCIISIPLIIILSGMLYLTGCRSAMLSLFFFIALSLINPILTKYQKLNKILLFLWAILPIIFVFYYLNNITGLDYDLSFGHGEEGKHNLTRLKSWTTFLELVTDSPVVGDYYGGSRGTGMFQALNSHLDVWLSYGIIPLILFILLLYKCVNQCDKGRKTLFQKMGLYAFLSIFIYSCFEGAIVAGSLGLFFPAIGYLTFANVKSTNNKLL